MKESVHHYQYQPTTAVVRQLLHSPEPAVDKSEESFDTAGLEIDRCIQLDIKKLC